MRYLNPVFAALLILARVSASAQEEKEEEKCLCFPNQPCWPSRETWSSFNASVSGNLVVDHDRNVPRYTITPEGPEQIIKTLSFASSHNIPIGSISSPGLVINTSEKMRHLSAIRYMDLDRPVYAIQSSSPGVSSSSSEMIKFASESGLVVVVSDSTPGPGPGPLSSAFGLRQDNILEYEIVTARGELITANRGENSDLFWALRNGGGSGEDGDGLGGFGVIVTTTIRAYRDLPVSFASVSIAVSIPSSETTTTTTTTEEETEEEEEGKILDSFYRLLPEIVDTGAVPVFSISPAGFILEGLAAPGLIEGEIDQLLAPFLDEVSSQQQEQQRFSKEVETFANYYEFYKAKHELFALKDRDGWLVSRDVVKEGKGNGYFNIVRELVNAGFIVRQQAFNVAPKRGINSDNAVSKAWRDALLYTTVSAPFDDEENGEEKEAALKALHNESFEKLSALATKVGAYVDETTPLNPNWKKDFFGENYDRLESIKNKYDPDHIFYRPGAVGSDY
ncbi:FAD/FMN-containing isoamyl alcohol oxidase MreA [Poronia punctata]|nr:FAD/FMN-containing isoamyl alcohol oxidase MreA [Poronia punctata]